MKTIRLETNSDSLAHFINYFFQPPNNKESQPKTTIFLLNDDDNEIQLYRKKRLKLKSKNLQQYLYLRMMVLMDVFVVAVVSSHLCCQL
jgi:hypothetical protein